LAVKTSTFSTGDMFYEQEAWIQTAVDDLRGGCVAAAHRAGDAQAAWRAWTALKVWRGWRDAPPPAPPG